MNGRREAADTSTPERSPNAGRYLPLALPHQGGPAGCPGRSEVLPCRCLFRVRMAISSRVKTHVRDAVHLYESTTCGGHYRTCPYSLATGDLSCRKVFSTRS